MSALRRFSLAVALLLACTAVAGAKPTGVKAGVPADELTPSGMTRVSVAAPMAAGSPARLVFAADGERAPSLLIDVLVTSSAADARAALAHWASTLQNAPDPSKEIGDAAYASPTIAAFARANVLIVVHRVAGQSDVLAIARAADTAVQRAEDGSPTAPINVPVPSIAPGKSALLAVPQDLLAVSITATGPANVTHEAAGWRLTRTGDGAISLTVRAVDVRLRQ